MSKKKIHIDQLFAQGLENLQIPVFSNDFDAIQEHIAPNEASLAFQNFELPVSENDWLSIKAKLEKERAKTPLIPITTESFMQDSFKDFEIAVTDSDWKAVQNKMGTGNKEKLVWWWWLNILIIAGVLGSVLNNYIPLKRESLSLNIKAAGIIHTSELFTSIAPTSSVNQSAFQIEKSNLAATIETNHTLHNTRLKTDKITAKYQSSAIKTPNKPAISNNITKKPLLTGQVVAAIPPLEKQQATNTFPIQPIVEEPKSSDKQVNDPPLRSASPLNNAISNKIPDAIIQPTPTTPVEIIANSPADTSKKKSSNQTPPLLPPKKLTPVLYFGINMAYDNAFRKLNKHNPEKYNTIRNTADKHANTLSFGIVAGVQLKNAQVQIGSQFMSQNWSSSYSYTYKVYDSIPVKNPQGNVIGYLLQRPRDTTINAQESVTIQKVNIPLMYNQLWKLNSKTKLLAGFGAAISYNRSATGTKMINPNNNQLYAYSALKKFENQWGFIPSLQFGVQRELKHHFVVQSSINGGYSMTNRFASSFGAKENTYSYGLSIKLLYLIQ